MTNVEKRLSENHITLPDCPVPVASYIPAQTAGNFVFAFRAGGHRRRETALCREGRHGDFARGRLPVGAHRGDPLHQRAALGRRP